MAASDGVAAVEGGSARRAHPRQLAVIWRRLRRRRSARGALAVFALIVIMCAAAPLYARVVAHTGPNANHLSDSIEVSGKRVDVVSRGGNVRVRGELTFVAGGIPIGPQLWRAGGRFVLGA